MHTSATAAGRLTVISYGVVIIFTGSCNQEQGGVTGCGVCNQLHRGLPLPPLAPKGFDRGCPRA
jgi:hypothetical protein